MDYTALVSTIQETMEDTGSTFVANIDRFIERASQRIFLDVDSESFSQIETTTGLSGQATLAQPSSEFVVKNVFYLKSGERIPLKYKTYEFVTEYWPIRASTGDPKYYSRYNNDGYFIIAPTPNSAYSYEITYIQQPATLSAANPTNSLTERAGNALFAACMVEANRFNKAWEQAGQWEQVYIQEVARLNNEARRSRRDDRAPNTRPGGGPNTVTGEN